jgi:hypothetical protein
MVRVFRKIAPTEAIMYIVTKDIVKTSVQMIQEVYDMRAKVDELHREIKQLIRVVHCQYRLCRFVCNHVASAFLVLEFLCRKAHATAQSDY